MGKGKNEKYFELNFIMNNKEYVLNLLRSKANSSSLEGMSHFGININQRLGLSVPDIRAIAKKIKPDHQLALDLWESGIKEARLLAGMVDVPSQVTQQQLEDWVMDFDSWDICDLVCNDLIKSTPFAWDKVYAWSTREEEYVKRAAFALLAILSIHDKQADDQKFTDTFTLIKSATTDPRNFVKKAVNWALRNIGKRNLALNQKAIELAEELLTLDNPTATWNARDALRELRSEKVQKRLAEKSKKKKKS